jgi:hypothetical protein
LKIWDSTDKLSFLGPGIPLFFDYGCFTLLCLLSAFLIYGLYTSLRYSRGNHCDEQAADYPGFCGAKWKTQTSAGNVPFEEIDNLEKLLSVILFFVLLGLRIVFYRNSKKKDCLIDEKNTTPVDYTVMISGIPKDTNEDEIIKNFADYDLGDNKKPQIQKCNMAYFIGDYVKHVKLKMKLEKEIYIENQKVNKKLKLSLRKTKLPQLKKKLEKVEKELKEIGLTLKGKKGVKEKAKLFTGICFLTFKTQLDATEVLDKWKVSFFAVIAMNYINFLKNCFTGTKERIKGKVVRVAEPPEPSDIIWENLGTPLKAKFKRRVLASFLSFFLLAVSFGCILALKLWKNRLSKEQNEEEGSSTKGLILSFVITGFISLINLLLKFVMRQISVQEKYTTVTGFHTGFLWKLVTVRNF